MAELEALQRALVAADRAGNTEDARILAAEIMRMQSAGRPVQRGSILPISKYPDGTVGFDSDSGLLGTMKRAFTLPGQAMRGEVPVMGSNGYPTDEAIGRSMEMGAVVSPMSPFLRSGDKMVPGVATTMRKAKVAAPSREMLKEAADTSFDAMRATGTDYSADAVKQWALETQAKIFREGYGQGNAPRVNAILSELASPPKGSVLSIGDAQTVRQNINKLLMSADPVERAAARQVKDALDGFIQNPPVSAVVAGRADRAASLLRDGNANYAAYKRSQQLDDALYNARVNAESANSGQNMDNAIRQQVRPILKSDKKSAGYSDAEFSALERVNAGVPGANRARAVGNMLGGGGGLGSAWVGGIGAAAGGSLGGITGIGAVPGGALGAVLPVLLGGALKKRAASLTKRGLEAADDLVRQRSPLYEEMVRNAPMAPNPPYRESLILRGLLGEELAPRQ